MTDETKRFVEDGYKDLEQLADDLWEHGITLGAPNKLNLKGNIAWILREVLSRVDGLPWFQRTRELHDAIRGMVLAAEEDELI